MADFSLNALDAEIVRLVGRLNYRTSYTQNQWKHAIEAAFLCGMMAEEQGLDLRLARRAALMHDIGKALTHELDGAPKLAALVGGTYAGESGGGGHAWVLSDLKTLLETGKSFAN